MFQGSSSAVPIYTMNADISLSAYDKLGTGASFIHPITGQSHSDKASKFVDDKTQFLNIQAVLAQQESPPHDIPSQLDLLLKSSINKSRSG